MHSNDVLQKLSDRWMFEYWGTHVPFPKSLIFGFVIPLLRRRVLLTIAINIVVLFFSLAMNTWFGYLAAVGLCYAASETPVRYYDKRPSYQESSFLVSLPFAVLYACAISNLLFGMWYLALGVIILLVVARIGAFILFAIPTIIIIMITEAALWFVIEPIRRFQRKYQD